MPMDQQSHQPLLKEETSRRRDSSSIEFEFQDDGYRNPRPELQRTLRSSLLRLAILSLVVFLSSALGYVAAWSVQKTVDGRVKSLKHHTTLTGIGELLYLPADIRSFNPDEILGLPATVESNKAWMGLLGPSMGYVAIKNFEKYGIPAGIPYPPDNSTNVYGVAMFHQLHCLIMIRERYYDLLTGRKGPDDFKTDSSHKLPKTLELNNGLLHLDHCFDYIQSGIRCAGQMDLQYPFKYGHVGLLTGEQQCRSWSAAMDIMDKLSFDISAFTTL